MTPGRKFSTSTSAVAIRRRAAATASCRFRSRTTLFFPVLSWPNEVLAPSRSGSKALVIGTLSSCAAASVRQDLAEEQPGALALGVGEKFLGRAAFDDL